MNSFPFQTQILVGNLLLDTENPRLPDTESSQDDTIRSMIKTQGNKILVLAQHLVDNGPNPVSLPIVIPTSKHKKDFYVLDGNRRLTALRLLERPELINGLMDNISSQKIKDLSLKYNKNSISKLECVVFGTREQADPWIQLIHRGESQGAGLVEWNGQVAARYDERRGIGERGAKAALQILDLVNNYKSVSDTTRQRIQNGKFPITNLMRLINTTYVRDKLLLDIKKDNIVSYQDKTLKGLALIVEDFGSGSKTVSDIKRLGQRIEYIDKLFDPHSVESKKPIDLYTPTLPLPPAVKKKKANKEEKPRTSLIPQNFLADVTQTRINKIFVELKKLNVDEFPNAASVMLRVFLELSLDHYLEETLNWPYPKIDNSKLAQKLIAIANDFESKQKMNAKQLASIRKAAGGQTLLVASINTLHGYVHNKHFSPIPSEIKTAWDDMEVFISNLWPV